MDKVLKKTPLNITVFTSKPNLIKKNKRVIVMKWNPSNPNLNVINKIQLKQSICCLFNALPKVNQDDYSTFYSSNSLHVIQVIKILHSKAVKVFFISTALSGLQFKRKFHYTTSKRIVENYIFDNNLKNCHILRLGPFRSNFSKDSISPFLQSSINFMGNNLFKLIFAKKSKTINYLPYYFKFFLIFLNVINSLFFFWKLK